MAANTFLTESANIGTVENGIWWFDGESNIKQLAPFGADLNVLTNAINSIDSNISMDNSTNLNGAVKQGIEVVENRLRQLRSNDVITAGAVAIFTDGTDQAARESAESALREVENADDGVTIYTIGLRGEIDEEFLNEIGKDGSAFADNLNELVAGFSNIAFRNQTGGKQLLYPGILLPQASRGES